MKKILTLLLCIILVCALPVMVYAEDTPTEDATEEAAPLPEESTPEEEKTVTELIKEYAISQYEEILVVVTIILSLFYQVRKHGALNKSVATLNNNSITVAEKSNTAIAKALEEVSAVSAFVSGFAEQVTTLLDEIRANAKDKQTIEATLAEAEQVLKTAKMANIEFANELAELLVLANIPNSVKEELFQRHRVAVASIEDAEKHTEVIENVGEEA